MVWACQSSIIGILHLSEIMKIFRDLIKPNMKFYWDETLDGIFGESKMRIIEAVKEGVKSFEPNCKTCLQTDFSEDGLGYLLLQKHCQCETGTTPACCKIGRKLIFPGSKFTSPPESRYSPTEGTALAVAFSLHHSRLFTLGCPNLIVSTDHEPLLGILNERDF